MEARLGVLDLRQEMLYEVGIHQRDMGFWQHHRDRGKAYRKVWCEGTGKRRKEEGHPGRDSQTESVEKTERCQETDQVELLTR